MLAVVLLISLLVVRFISLIRHLIYHHLLCFHFYGLLMADKGGDMLWDVSISITSEVTFNMKYTADHLIGSG
jgi:hypothetical protein